MSMKGDFDREVVGQVNVDKNALPEAERFNIRKFLHKNLRSWWSIPGEGQESIFSNKTSLRWSITSTRLPSVWAMEEQGTVMISIQGPDDKYETTALLGVTPSKTLLLSPQLLYAGKQKNANLAPAFLQTRIFKNTGTVNQQYCGT